jgi:NADPH:quinone reductase-like Zn-dependent oxidoreductase
MKAIIYNQYGTPDVLELSEVQKPIVKENEVLVKVYAASANAADAHLLSGLIPRLMGHGWLHPKNRIPGADMAGVVEAVGKNVRDFKPGDEVYGDLAGCGFGTFAEYVAANENALALKPSNLSFEEAAAVPMAAVTALQGLRKKGEVKAGQKVLINGASGGVGTFAIQIAKAFKAEVTAVCSTGKIELVRSLGADHVIDYTKQDFTDLANHPNGKLYDLIIGANGYRPISQYKKLLNENGIYVMTGGTGSQFLEVIFLGPIISMRGNKKIDHLMAKPNRRDLEVVKSLIELGKIKPVIEQCFPLKDAAKALWHIKNGHAKGKVVIQLQEKMPSQEFQKQMKIEQK